MNSWEPPGGWRAARAFNHQTISPTPKQRFLGRKILRHIVGPNNEILIRPIWNRGFLKNILRPNNPTLVGLSFVNMWFIGVWIHHRHKLVRSRLASGCPRQWALKKTYARVSELVLEGVRPETQRRRSTGHGWRKMKMDRRWLWGPLWQMCISPKQRKKRQVWEATKEEVPSGGWQIWPIRVLWCWSPPEGHLHLHSKM